MDSEEHSGPFQTLGLRGSSKSTTRLHRFILKGWQCLFDAWWLKKSSLAKHVFATTLSNQPFINVSVFTQCTCSQPRGEHTLSPAGPAIDSIPSSSFILFYCLVHEATTSLHEMNMGPWTDGFWLLWSRAWRARDSSQVEDSWAGWVALLSSPSMPCFFTFIYIAGISLYRPC